MEKIKATCYQQGDNESWWIKITFRLPADFNKDFAAHDFDGRLDLEEIVVNLRKEIVVRSALTGKEVPFGWYSLGRYYSHPGGPFQHEPTFRINTLNRIVITAHGGLDI